MSGDRSPAAEHWIFLNSSLAQKPQRNGLEKKFFGINVGTHMLVQVTPGPVHLTRWLLPSIFTVYCAKVEFVREGRFNN